jgi:hypothetical protein
MIYTVVNITLNDICFKKYYKPEYSQDFKAQSYKKSHKICLRCFVIFDPDV